MSENTHAVAEHGAKKVANPHYRVPIALPIIAILVVVAMWLYADRWDPNPEITVSKYFQAVNARQYDIAADQWSVFPVAGLFPEYQELTPAELVNKRPEIVKEIAEILEGSPAPNNVKATIESSHTKIGEYGALVAFYQEQEGQPKQMMAALLIKEAGRFRILSHGPASAEAIEEFSKSEFKEFDANLKSLFEENK